MEKSHPSKPKLKKRQEAGWAISSDDDNDNGKGKGKGKKLSYKERKKQSK